MDPLGFPAAAPRGNPIAQDFRNQFGGGDLRTLGGRLNLTFSPTVHAWALIDTGTVKSTGATFTTWEAGASWHLAPTTVLSVFYADNIRGPVRTNYWGAQLSTRW
jgi:hypothetical protein